LRHVGSQVNRLLGATNGTVAQGVRLALRHEICTVLIIEDPAGTSARAGSCGSVTMWWDRLRASTIVAPGAAAVELGLQVARAVVS
jgi:hypothetical protein